MSKVTDRLDNKQIIELAKKNYDNKQKSSKFPGHIVKFPSAGKVYPESSPLRNGSVEMRAMTAYDEDILTNSSYLSEGILFDKLLEALILTSGVDVNDIINADKESLIISARILGYGAEYETIITKDGKEQEYTVDLSQLKYEPFELESDENGEFLYENESTGDVLKYRYMNSAESAKISKENLISDFLKYTVTEVNGSRTKKDIDNFLTYNFRAIDSKKFRAYVINNTPSINYDIEIEGEDGSTFTAGFLPGADLFWF